MGRLEHLLQPRGLRKAFLSTRRSGWQPVVSSLAIIYNLVAGQRSSVVEQRFRKPPVVSSTLTAGSDAR
jgi:hypothetical protein